MPEERQLTSWISCRTVVVGQNLGGGLQVRRSFLRNPLLDSATFTFEIILGLD